MIINQIHDQNKTLNECDVHQEISRKLQIQEPQSYTNSWSKKVSYQKSVMKDPFFFYVSKTKLSELKYILF